MRIQKRDRELMYGLSKYGVLSTRQIVDWHFTGVDKYTVLRRLRKLEAYGLILNPSTLPNATKLWSLSKVGAKVIGAPDPYRYSNRNTALHDVTLSTLRKHLESLDIAADWTSDVEMKRELGRNIENSVVPDGLFVTELTEGEAVMAIELELHPKSHRRYRKIFKEYAYRRSAISHIFYVVKNDAIKIPIITSWRKFLKEEYLLRKKQKLIFATLDEILDDPQSALISFTNDKTIPLFNYFKCPPRTSELEQSVSTSTGQNSNSLGQAKAF